MKSTSDLTVLTTPEYRQFIEDLKARVLSARTSAARAVSSGMILLYWDIGRGIVEKQQSLGWSDSVVEKVAADLRRAFPEIRGFSLANIWRMRQLHLLYSSDAILAQAARDFHNGGAWQKAHSFLGQAVPKRETASEDMPTLAQVVRETGRRGKGLS